MFGDEGFAEGAELVLGGAGIELGFAQEGEVSDQWCHVPFQLRKRRCRKHCRRLDQIGIKYASLLKKMEWVSLGGGHLFHERRLSAGQILRVLKDFSERFGVQVYLEPGEAAITCSTELVTTVLDVVHNEVDIAIVDASVEAHMLDHLIYRTSPKISSPGPGTHPIMIAGRTCLAGDVFGSTNWRRS